MPIAFSDNKNSSKRPLVLIHAFPLDRRMWDHQVNGLENIIRVIAPDTPGFGNSDRLTDKPSMSAYVTSLLQFLDDQGIEQAVFGGCSMGGYILFELWRKAPERTAGLILWDTRADADAPDARENRLKTIKEVRENGAASLAETMPAKLLSPVTFKTRTDLVDELKKTILNNPKEGIADAQQALADRPDSTNTLRTITAPALILVGEDDVLTPPELAQSMHSQIQNSRLEIIPQAGHLSPLEQPEKTNAIVESFLREGSLLK
ncbi:MAG: alpha/beta fold hydrolase [Candidatus Omnitrophica bacterium]|nr:alpha/beta fold hydrolase [Candidatus Omnitrophota bacterium]